MFGLGGMLNRFGWSFNGNEYYDDGADMAILNHMEDTGCAGGRMDTFEGDPYLYCHHCGNPIAD